MRGRRATRGLRASATGARRGAAAGALTVALLLACSVLAFGVGPAAAQTDDSTPSDGAGEGEAPREVPECAREVAGLSLATTLDFADVVRALAPEGSAGDPRSDIASYELYCPYGELPASAPSDAKAPLELLLSWGVVASLDGPGCVAGGESDAAGTSGVVGDPDRRAQVDWETSDEGATEAEAVAAAEALLALTPTDAVSCDADASGGGSDEAAATDDGSSNTTIPLIVIGAAVAVALLAVIVLLVRRRRSGTVEPPPGAEPRSVPVGPAVGPSPTAGPLLAGASAPQRAARLAPEGVQRSRAAAGAGTATRARAVADAARVAASSGVGHQAATLALVAAAAGTLADADVARGQHGPADPQLDALAENLRTLARGAARGARRAGTTEAAAPSSQVDALLRATTRLVDAHGPLLSGSPPPEAPR